MDLFAFIRHSNPTKVRIEERACRKGGDSGDSIDKLFDEGNDDVPKETVAKDVSEVAIEKTKKKRKNERVSLLSLSVTWFRMVLMFRAGSKSSAVVFVPPTPDDRPTDSISYWDVLVTTVVVTTTVTANASAVPPPEFNEPADSSDSFYASHDLDSETLHRIYVSKWNVTNDSVLDDPYVCRDLTDRLAPPALFHNCEQKDRFEDKCSEQTTLLSERDAEIAHLKSLLSLKEAEAAEAIRLRGQISAIEAVDAAKGNELRDFKERNFVLEREKDVLFEKVKTLESAAALKETELASLAAQVAQLTSDLSGFQLSRDELSFKVASLESERDCLVSQLLEMAAHIDEEFYPRFLTAISGRRWILTHGLKIVLLKCLQSLEYCHALGQAIDCAVNKGIQDDLRAGIDHGKAGRDLSVIEAYDPFAEAKYVEVVSALGIVDFSLLSELKSKKDASIVDLMDSREIMEKHLSLTDVMVPLAEPLSSRSLIGEASTSAAPATSEPITTISTTFASFDVVPPLSISNDQFLHDEDPRAVTFEKEELDTSLE
nr:hypothetical protein [Tanacetum cinerariifolium]